VPVRIDVQRNCGAYRNLRSDDAADKGRRVIASAGSDAADGNYIGIAAKTRIADIDVVANNARLGTGKSA
jgi:hypothetical protein